MAINKEKIALTTNTEEMPTSAATLSFSTNPTKCSIIPGGEPIALIDKDGTSLSLETKEIKEDVPVFLMIGKTTYLAVFTKGKLHMSRTTVSQIQIGHSYKDKINTELKNLAFKAQQTGHTRASHTEEKPNPRAFYQHRPENIALPIFINAKKPPSGKDWEAES